MPQNVSIQNCSILFVLCIHHFSTSCTNPAPTPPVANLGLVGPSSIVASCLEHFHLAGVARELKYYSRSYGGLRDPSLTTMVVWVGGKLGGNWMPDAPKIPPDFCAKNRFEQWNLEVETFDNLSSFGDEDVIFQLISWDRQSLVGTCRSKSAWFDVIWISVWLSVSLGTSQPLTCMISHHVLTNFLQVVY